MKRLDSVDRIRLVKNGGPNIGPEGFEDFNFESGFNPSMFGMPQGIYDHKMGPADMIDDQLMREMMEKELMSSFSSEFTG